MAGAASRYFARMRGTVYGGEPLRKEFLAEAESAIVTDWLLGQPTRYATPAFTVLVDAGSQVSQSTWAFTSARAAPVGAVVAACIYINSNVSAITSFTDTAGNTWTLRAQQTSNAAQLWVYTSTLTTGIEAGHTFTVTMPFSQNRFAATVIHIAGVASDAPEASALASGAATTTPSVGPSGNLDPASPRALVLGVFGAQSGTSGTVWSSTTPIGVVSQGGSSGATSSNRQVVAVWNVDYSIGDGASSRVTSSVSSAFAAAVLVLPLAVAANQDASATVAGSGVVTAAGSAIGGGGTNVDGSASVVGAGVVTAAGFVVAQGSASVVGAGVVAAAPLVVAQAAASVVGSGVVTATPAVVAQGAATVVGSGVVTAAGVVGVTAAASVVGSGVVTAAPVVVAQGAATVVGSGVVTAAAYVVVQGAGSVAGAGVVTAAPTVAAQAAAAVSGAGVVTAAGSVGVPGAATVAGAGVVTAAGVAVTPGGAVTGSASVVGAGVVSAAPTVAAQASAAVVGAGVVTATGLVVAQGSSSVAGSGVVTATPVVGVPASASVVGAGVVTASGVTVADNDHRVGVFDQPRPRGVASSPSLAGFDASSPVGVASSPRVAGFDQPHPRGAE